MEAEETNDLKEATVERHIKWLKKFPWTWYWTLRLWAGREITAPEAQEKFRKWISALEAAQGGEDFHWVVMLDWLEGARTFRVFIGGLENGAGIGSEEWKKKWEDLGGYRANVRSYDEVQARYLLESITTTAGDLEVTCKLPPNSPAPPKIERWKFDIHGAGTQPNGTGGFAWVQRDEDVARVKWLEERISSNQAKYRALVSVLRCVPEYSIVRLYTNSQAVYQQFHQDRNFGELSELVSQANREIQMKHLEVSLELISAAENEARKLLTEERKVVDRAAKRRREAAAPSREE